MIDQMGKMEQNIDSIANATHKIIEQVTLSELETHIVETSELAFIKANEIATYIDRTARGLYTGLSGKLSPMLVDAKGFADALLELTKKADARRYNAIYGSLCKCLRCPVLCTCIRIEVY